MELTTFLDGLRHDLQAAAAAGDERTRETARLLSVALDPSARLCLVEAMTAMADEVTSAWGTGAVEIRMHGRDPQVVVTQDQPHPPPPPPPPTAPTFPGGPAEDDTEDGSTARISLRLPEGLKARAERSAALEGLSVNAWLVRAIATAIQPGGGPQPGGTRSPAGRRMTGFARG